MNKNDMKALVVAGLLFFMFLIALAYIVPYAYNYTTEGVVVGTNESDGTDIVMSVEDVPGGGIVVGLAFVLGLLTFTIVAILKIVDLI